MQVGEQIGPFTVERELGSGAMGTVYRALYSKDDGRQSRVALKVVSYGLTGNEGALARFEREANILKQLRHPHIVRLIATGRYKKTPFIAMEYVDGEALDRVLLRRGRLGWEDVVGYGKQLCLALQHAHDKGIIHRDLKPSNLMLTKDGKLKLTDFGIAKDTDVTALTAQNNTIGTAAYMSPEQCRGDKTLCPRSDLYSLGVVFYELLTGKKPFVAETTMDLFLKHVNDRPVRPARVVPDLPVWVDNLVMFLLEKDREQRPIDAGTVGKMLEDIEAKVAAGVSAGETVAKSRRADRKLGDGPLDDADKAAATALRGGKKKKKKGRAWYQAEWVKAVPLGLAVLGLAAGAYYLLRPEPLAAQYARVEAAPADGKLEAVSDFLLRNKAKADPLVEQARNSYQQLVARDKERVLLKRLGTKLEGNDEGFDAGTYPDAVAALKAERAGDLAAAAAKWQAVQGKSAGDPAKLPDDAEAARACLGWIAAAHLHDLRDGLPAADRGLKTALAEARTYETAYKADGPDGAATRALLFEEYADKARARAAWLALAEEAGKDSDKRVWLVLAAQRAAAVGEVKDDPDARAARAARLAAVLVEREEAVAAATDPADDVPRRAARNAARELVLLYDGDPAEAVRTAVARAKKLYELAKKRAG